MLARDAILCIIVGAYFLSNSLCSTDRKYTSQDLKGFVEAKAYFDRNYKECCDKVNDCLKSMLA